MTPEKLATDVEAPIIQTWSALDHPTSSPFFLSLSLSFFFPWVIIIADPHHGTRRNKTERHPSRWRASERPIKVKSRAWDVWRTGHYVQRYRRWFSFHSFPCGVVTCQRVQQHKKMWIVSSLSARRDDVNHKPRISNLIFFFIGKIRFSLVISNRPRKKCHRNPSMSFIVVQGRHVQVHRVRGHSDRYDNSSSFDQRIEMFVLVFISSVGHVNHSFKWNVRILWEKIKPNYSSFSFFFPMYLFFYMRFQDVPP